MKKIYDILTSSFLARYIFLLTFIISIVTLFGNIEIEDFPRPIFFIKLCLVFITPLFLNIFFEIFIKHLFSNIEDTRDISNALNHRIGPQISLQTLDNEGFDYIHKYSLVFRQDQLKLSGSDYNSFRILKGINDSKNNSSYLIHTESMDVPISFEEININAKNNVNGKELVVECLHSTTEKRLQHTFKINFDIPIAPNKEFDISYSMTIPNEISFYHEIKNIQSISLIRIKKPIAKLIFNICLDFEPRAIKMYTRKRTNEIKEINGATVKKYLPSNELQTFYNIQWGASTPYIIETEIQNPKYKQYIIEFLK